MVGAIVTSPLPGPLLRTPPLHYVYFFSTSLLTFAWHRLISAFPNPPRLGSRLKSGWCNDFHFLKSTPDPRPTRREDICCTWDQSQVGKRKLRINKKRKERGELNVSLRTLSRCWLARRGLVAQTASSSDVLGYSAAFMLSPNCGVQSRPDFLQIFVSLFFFFALHAVFTWITACSNPEQNVLINATQWCLKYIWSVAILHYKRFSR